MGLVYKRLNIVLHSKQLQAKTNTKSINKEHRKPKSSKNCTKYDYCQTMTRERKPYTLRVIQHILYKQLIYKKECIDDILYINTEVLTTGFVIPLWTKCLTTDASTQWLNRFITNTRLIICYMLYQTCSVTEESLIML